MSNRTATSTHSTKSGDAQFRDLISNTYSIGKRIGSGSYGDVRLGTNVRTKQAVAIKFEKVGESRNKHLELEKEVYDILGGYEGFPKMYYYGIYKDFRVLVMEVLGRSLEYCLEHCGGRFTLKTTIFLALQLIKRFKAIHEQGYIYQDVKPANLLLGQSTNTVHVVDFGIASTYRNEHGNHISPGTTSDILGTYLYMPINAHNRKIQSRKDDLESIGYLLAEFLTGKLPWAGMKGNSSKEHNMLICMKKKSTSPSTLFSGQPAEFVEYFKYARELAFDATPNYERHRNAFKKLFQAKKYQDDGVYDWNRKK